MQKLAAIVIAILATPASAESLPSFDFRAYCSTHPLGREACVNSELNANVELRAIWPRLGDKDKAYCLDGVSSYLDLWQCAKIKEPLVELTPTPE